MGRRVITHWASSGKAARIVLLLALCLYGCTHAEKPAVETTVVPQVVFPPQQVMESGDYAGFLAQNETALKSCNESEQCATILFNLGFVHAYSKSPYHDKAKALSYLNRLVKGYPGTALAYQSQAWIDLLGKSMSLDRKSRRLKGQIKAKDAAIEELRDQIQRSRDIDVEMDRKERELLH